MLDTYATLKNIKSKLKFKDKSWITSGLQKSVSIKNHYLSKFIRVNKSNKGSPNEIKRIQKSFIDSVKKSKQFYVKGFFQQNFEDLKNIWKGIKK